MHEIYRFVLTEEQRRMLEGFNEYNRPRKRIVALILEHVDLLRRVRAWFSSEKETAYTFEPWMVNGVGPIMILGDPVPGTRLSIRVWRSGEKYGIEPIPSHEQRLYRKTVKGFLVDDETLKWLHERLGIQRAA